MLALLVVLALGQVKVRDEGTAQGSGWVDILNCTGSGITCTVAARTATIEITTGEGGGVPSSIPAITYSATADLSAERVLSAGNYTVLDNATTAQSQVDWVHGLTCGAGSVLTSSGTTAMQCVSNVATATALAADPTACGAGQYVSDVSAAGVLTCSQPPGTYALPDSTSGVTGGVRLTGDLDEGAGDDHQRCERRHRPADAHQLDGGPGGGRLPRKLLPSVLAAAEAAAAVSTDRASDLRPDSATTADPRGAGCVARHLAHPVEGLRARRADLHLGVVAFLRPAAGPWAHVVHPLAALADGDRGGARALRGFVGAGRARRRSSGESSWPTAHQRHHGDHHHHATRRARAHGATLPSRTGPRHVTAVQLWYGFSSRCGSPGS